MTKIENLYLHIGRHKSATTTIQSWLDYNRSNFIDNGFLYLSNQPTITRGKWGASHNLAASCIDISKEGYKKMEEASKIIIHEAEMSNCKNIILSSEGFQNINNTKLIEFLISIILPKNVIIICIFREFLDYAISSYRQVIHANPKYIKSLDLIKSYSKHIDIENFHKRWSNIGEFHGLVLDDYNPKTSELFHKLEQIFGINSSSISYIKDQKNISIGGDLLAYKLLINLQKPEMKDIPSAIKKLYRKLESFAASEREFSRPFFISDKFATKIQKDSKYNQYIEYNFGKLKYKFWSDFDIIPSKRISENLENFNLVFSDLVSEVNLTNEYILLLKKAFELI